MLWDRVGGRHRLCLLGQLQLIHTGVGLCGDFGGDGFVGSSGLASAVSLLERLESSRSFFRAYRTKLDHRLTDLLGLLRRKLRQELSSRRGVDGGQQDCDLPNSIIQLWRSHSQPIVTVVSVSTDFQKGF